MTLTQPDFDFIRTLVRKRSAVILENEKAYLVETRLFALARYQGFDSMKDLVDQMRAEPYSILHQKVVEVLTNNETSFFRDLHPFEALRQHILPELVRRRTAEHSLHIWCGACSSGQEPYSLAMLLREHFPSLTGWDLRILASDLSSEILQRAQLGRYSQAEVNRGLPARLLVKYFQQSGADWQIKDEIRHMVEFQPINLINAWPSLPAQDIIFVRNVLMYFDVATKKQILEKMRRLLRPDGYLFLGGAETTLNVHEAFERAQFERSACYRLRAG